MRLLLDTHAFVWWVTFDLQLSRRAEQAIAGNDCELCLSPVVPWEIETKIRTRSWEGAERALDEIDGMVTEGVLIPVPITLRHARRAGSIVSPHRDPFDRMLAAQASLEGLTLVTRDPAFQTLGCETLW